MKIKNYREIYKHEAKSYLIVRMRKCEKANHVQQVTYSTHHEAFTQICFTCNKVRTTMDKKDLPKK